MINLFAAILVVLDKHRAKRHLYRVPERTLLLVSALGGSVLMYLFMHLVHHKTKHPKFMVGIPFIFAGQCVFAWLIYHTVYL